MLTCNCEGSDEEHVVASVDEVGSLVELVGFFLAAALADVVVDDGSVTVDLCFFVAGCGGG